MIPFAIIAVLQLLLILMWFKWSMKSPSKKIVLGVIHIIFFFLLDYRIFLFEDRAFGDFGMVEIIGFAVLLGSGIVSVPTLFLLLGEKLKLNIELPGKQIFWMIGILLLVLCAFVAILISRGYWALPHG